MSTKLPIASDDANFEIYQEMFDNDKVYIKLHDFVKLMSDIETLLKDLDVDQLS